MINTKMNKIKLLKNRIEKSEKLNSNFPKIYLWKIELKKLEEEMKNGKN